MISAVIVAAGSGKRFGGDKQFALLAGKPVVWYAARPFLLNEAVSEIVVVVPPREKDMLPGDLGFSDTGNVIIIPGGERRQDSVCNGLGAVSCAGEDGIVLVHDGVRPLLRKELLDVIIEEARKGKSIIPAVAVTDTLKEVVDGRVQVTLDRNRLSYIQTPQAFPVDLLRAAHEKARENGIVSTDDARLVELLGSEIRVVPGDRDNIKITTQHDLELASFLLRKRCENADRAGV